MSPISIFSITFLRRVWRGAIVGGRLAAGPGNWHKVRLVWRGAVAAFFVALVVAVVIHSAVEIMSLLLPL